MQVPSFDFGERLTRETVFVGVRSSPSIAKHTVYRKRTLRKSIVYFNRLSKLTSRTPQEQFVFAPTLCKLNSIFCRRYKSTRDLRRSSRDFVARSRSLRERSSRLRRSLAALSRGRLVGKSIGPCALCNSQK